MSFSRLIVTFFIFFCTVKSFSQNDCVNAIIACGNSDYTGLSASGVGVQELSSSNTCGSQENNSIWLRISVNTGGTLGFTLTPESRNISEDYDFFIFGPNATCGNIGMAIRCSTTNPQAAGATSNLTGMNETEVDNSEGPGEFGNSFVRSLFVNAGDTYFLVIDRPVGNSNFSITWSGTATFNEAPVVQIPSGTTINLKNCINDFNLELNTPIMIGTQTGVAVTYHRSQNDGLTGVNPITDTTNFQTTQNPQTLYARITNTFTGCSTTEDFIVSVENPINIPNNTYEICDNLADGDDQNGLATFNLNEVTDAIMQGENRSGLTFSYFRSSVDASIEFSPFSTTFANSIPNQESIFIKVENANGCSDIKEIFLTVKSVPNKINATLTQCDTGLTPDGLTFFNLNEALPQLTSNDQNLSVEYIFNGNIIPSDYTNVTNPQTVTVRITNLTTSCSSLSTLVLNVNTTPSQNISIDAQCDLLNFEDGFREFNLNNSSLILNLGETVAFYTNLQDALLESNVIQNPATYRNETAYDQIVYARIENTNSCTGISELALKVHPLPKISADYTDYVCINLPFNYLNLSSGLLQGDPNDFNYEWSTGENSQTIRTNLPGTYTVKVTSAVGCDKTRTITVLPSNNATIENIEIIDNSDNNQITVFLTASSLGDYSYSLDSPSGPYQTSNHFENVSPGFHTVYVYDNRGCGIIFKEVTVLKMPRFFSPNGDGYNETWDIIGISPQFYAKSKIYIFDRFGKILADIKPLSNGWNGIFNGQPLPSSDYWYVVKLDNGRTIKGHFSLIR